MISDVTFGLPHFANIKLKEAHRVGVYDVLGRARRLRICCSEVAGALKQTEYTLFTRDRIREKTFD